MSDITKRLIFTNLVGQAIDKCVQSCGSPQIILLADTNTADIVVPILQRESIAASKAEVITIHCGENHKDIAELTKVWQRLSDAGATRKTILINVGGGLVTDLGGFAAATFKRGMRFINVPTTVLGAVDASYGGKTGINFNDAKNQIGVFADPLASIISSKFFGSLAKDQILSGYAEMIKHALLDNIDSYRKLISFNPCDSTFDNEQMLSLIKTSSLVKQKIVDADPHETGLRKVLNLGHTAGHAFESMAISDGKPIPHGYAVAWGFVVALVLSHMKFGFPSAIIHNIADYVLTNYGAFEFDCRHYPALLELMKKDKKNDNADSINFTLLKDIGEPISNCITSQKDIESALDIYRDLMKI